MWGRYAPPHAVLHRFQASHVSTGTTNNALALNPSGGNVGVGTTAPAVKLQVTSVSGSAHNTIAWGTNDGAAMGALGTSQASYGSGALYVYQNGGTATPAVRISAGSSDPSYFNQSVASGGILGIGTTAPAATLDVAGNIRTLNPIYTLKASVTATSGNAVTVALMDINASGTYLVSVNGIGGGFVTIAGVAMVIMYFDGASNRYGLMNSMSVAYFAWTSINPATGVITFTQNSGYTAVCNFSALRIA